MKTLFTLAAAGTLAAASLTAEAQVTVDGQLTAAEVTAGNYQLLGKYTNPRGFGDAGLLSLYAASSGSKLYIFVGGTLEANGNAFQLFLDLPGASGVPVGTSLPTGTAGTSFQNVAFKLDLAADVALALRSDTAPDYKVEGISYVGNPATGSSMNLTTSAAPLASTGAVQTLAPTATTGPGLELLAGTQMAYRVAAMAGISNNPGNTSPNTGPTYGGVGSYGWEIAIDRATANLTSGTVNMFILQNGGDGGYASTDFIPQTSAPLPSTTNSGNLASGAFDFTTLPDLQSAAITLTPLGTRAADEAAVAMSVFPNPAQGSATVSYQVAKTEAVNIVLTDLMGRTVRTLASGSKAAGLQSATVSTADVAAGTYLVRVQVGERVAMRKVVLL